MKNKIMDMSFLRNSIRYFSMMAFLAICGSSCQDINIIEENAPARVGDNIRFEVSSEKKSLTVKNEQERQEIEPIVLVSENDSITLKLYPTITPIGEQVEMMTTKSEKVTSKNVIDKTIRLTALCADHVTDSPIIPSTPLMYDSWKVQDNISIWKTNPEYQWPSSTIRFFAWSPAENVNLTNGTFDGVNGVMSFHYTMPEPSEDHNDAANQPDLIFANVESSVRNGSEVPLLFDHVLSAIRFEVGKTNDLQVLSISLKNILSSGTCTYDPEDIDDAVVWSYVENPKNYIQVFDSEDGSIDEDLAYEPGTGTPQTIGRESKTFMVIPQTSTENNPIILEVVIQLKGGKTPITLTAELTDDMANWLAGKLYTYVIRTDVEKLSISVDDMVDGITKSELMIMNELESNIKCYLRAMIIGNWFEKYVEDGEQPAILASWSITDGTFSPALPTAGNPSNNWMLGADGYYYYKYPVYPGDETYDKLFTTYTGPTTSKIDDSFLKIQIVAQGVVWDERKLHVAEAWQDEQVISFLSAIDKE